MIRRLRLPILGFGLLLALGSAFAAANVVGSSKAGVAAFPQNANTLKPPECAGLNLTQIRVLRGTGQADLVLGTAGNNRIVARRRGDCIVAGAGNDIIDGGLGTDVCIGGPGTDVFIGCETQYQ